MRTSTKAMKLAWAIIRDTTNNITTLSQALRQAWMAVQAQDRLKTERTLVTFRKADGTVTQRLATAFDEPVKGTGKSNPLTVVFYSITDQATRCFRADRLIGFGRG